jgi:Fe2+ transport system protein FeoA
MELGFLNSVKIEFINKSIFGYPKLFKIRNRFIALSEELCSNIVVEEQKT